ncbi:MAG: DUF493 domain-containing protein [Betaproteobacteria bacterium]|nr:DUF493 domain-containing protein [Betaproteobacteria bacterium]
MNDPENNSDNDALFEFPCDFPIKAMGYTVDGFAQTVMGIVLQHAPDFDPATLEMRSSSTGKYLSVTCTIRAVSRAQLDALYRELSGHPSVVMVL